MRAHLFFFAFASTFGDDASLPAVGGCGVSALAMLVASLPRQGIRRTRHLAGQAHPKAQLSDDEVRAMRARYVPGKVGYGTLAKEFNVPWRTCKDIVTYATRASA